MTDRESLPDDRYPTRPGAVLRLAIELPGFFLAGDETNEDIEVAMQLATDQVVVTFAAHEGDSPQVFVKPLEGQIVDIGARLLDA